MRQMKYNLYDCVIEVTRRCNMSCAHCLRGESQAMDIDTKYIDALLKNVQSISCLTFSGGEPSLNIQAIEYTLEKCKELGIYVGSFYVVTNGKIPMLSLASACLKWYAFCEDKEYCGLALSKDMFHANIDRENEELLRGLSFFREDKFTDFNKTILINEGRAEELSVNFKRQPYEPASLYCEDGDIETMIYLSANGEIRVDCDTAYNNTKYTIGNLNTRSFEQIVSSAIEKAA